MVKVTVESEGRVTVMEGNLAVVAVASEEEDGVCCKQAVQGWGTRYLEVAAKHLAASIPGIVAEYVENPVDAMAIVTEFSALVKSQVKKSSEKLLRKIMEVRTE